METVIRCRQPCTAPPARAFALTLDGRRFAPLFRGCGPVPGLLRIDAVDRAAVGAQRLVHSRDGAVLQECITALAPPHLHAYRLHGLRPPLAWLVSDAEASWRFSPTDGGCLIDWEYRWRLRSALAWPLAWPLLHLFFQRAMRRCLQAMAMQLKQGTD